MQSEISDAIRSAERAWWIAPGGSGQRVLIDGRKTLARVTPHGDDQWQAETPKGYLYTPTRLGAMREARKTVVAWAIERALQESNNNGTT
jgi:hypothetical protein